MQDHHLVCNVLHCKSTNFYISFLLNCQNLTFNTHILVGNIIQVGKKTDPMPRNSCHYQSNGKTVLPGQYNNP